MFWIISDSTCAECGEELGRGRFLRLEAERPLCLSCADLAHLVFLESGNAALTRRATRYSTLHAVVVRFSRARKRYERQGVLVEEAALAQAEAECLSDADMREAARQRAAAKRMELDATYVEAFARRIGELFPGSPSMPGRRSQNTRARSTPAGWDDRLRRKNLTRMLSNSPSARMFVTRTRPTIGSWHAERIGRTPVEKSPQKWMHCWRDGHRRDDDCHTAFMQSKQKKLEKREKWGVRQ